MAVARCTPQAAGSRLITGTTEKTRYDSCSTSWCDGRDPDAKCVDQFAAIQTDHNDQGDADQLNHRVQDAFARAVDALAAIRADGLYAEDHERSDPQQFMGVEGGQRRAVRGDALRSEQARDQSDERAGQAKQQGVPRGLVEVFTLSQPPGPTEGDAAEQKGNGEVNEERVQIGRHWNTPVNPV